MVLLGVVSLVEARVGPFGGSVCLAQDRCMVYDECTSGMEIALGTPEWYSKVMYVKWKLVSVYFEIVFVLAEDKCMVCAECTSSMEIDMGTPEWYYLLIYVKRELVSVRF